MPSLSLSRSGQPSSFLEAVEVLGLVRTLVLGVGDAVLIVVEIGTTVLVFEAVLVFRFVRTLVANIRNAVVISIGKRIRPGFRRRGGAGLAWDRCARRRTGARPPPRRPARFPGGPWP